MSYSSFTNEEDFVAAYDLYADDIFRHCYLQVFSREKAKEIMTEAFTRLWQFIVDGNVVDSMQLFLYRMSHQLIQEEGKRGALSAVPAEAEEPSEFAALRKIDPADRSVVILHYVDGFSLPEIDAIIGGRTDDHENALRKGTELISSLL